MLKTLLNTLFRVSLSLCIYRKEHLLKSKIMMVTLHFHWLCVRGMKGKSIPCAF